MNKQLTSQVKTAIVADKAIGMKTMDIAAKYDVSQVTVWRLCKDVKENAPKWGAGQWKEKLYTALVPNSVNAIERSINDLQDVHKAAGTAMAHLKAVGVVKDESNVTTNIFVNVQDLPEDWYSRMRPVDPADRSVIDVTPEESTG